VLGGLELASRSVHKKPWLGFLHLGNPKTFVQPLRSPVKILDGGPSSTLLQLLLWIFNSRHAWLEFTD
jgi:hypothetical protein